MPRITAHGLTFDGPELSTIVHALRVAATLFDDNVKIATDAQHPRLAEQFTRQAADARTLADAIEE